MSPLALDPRLQLFVGVDGGGTRCRVRVRDAEGVLLGEAEGGSCNIRLGLDLVWKNILGALDTALAQGGLDSSAYPRLSLGLGLAGICCDEDVRMTVNAAPCVGRCDASSDAHTACLGAFSGKDGGVLISGTGSVAYAWVGGKASQIGGWGFEVSDDGSAADLGRSAIRAALRGVDGLGPTSDFTHALIAHFGGQPSDIVHWVTSAKPCDHGALAPMILKFAQAGDVVAAGLVRKSAQDLGDYIARLQAMGAPRVCLVGGMAPVFMPWLSDAARAALSTPEHDALEGAILLAHGHSNGFARQEVSA
jgi:glucosamine kinase